MQKPGHEFSFEVDEETRIKEQHNIQEGTEPWGHCLDLVGDSYLGNAIISSYEMSAPSDTETPLYPNSMQKQSVRSHPHLLKIPSEENDEGDNIPRQFVRYAPGRISTSPTLRRLRKSTLSISQILPHQSGTENPRMGNQSEVYLPICQSSPFSDHFFFSESFMHPYPQSQRENSASIDTTLLLCHEENDPSGDQPSQNAVLIGSSFQSEGEQNSQECTQVMLPIFFKRVLFSIPWIDRFDS